MFDFITVARTYAKAAFDFSIKHQAVKSWQNMLVFAVKVARNEYIAELFSRSLAPEIISEIFITICDNELDEFARNFIRIMAENGRLQILPEILEQFIQLRALLESTIEIEVFSARVLNDTQRKKISTAIKKKLKLLHKIKLNCKIDKSIIAGVIIRTNDIVIDGSVRSHIRRLSGILQS
ncbi:F0F1 ATP synthase subunit delta [Candidatus Fukatsuia anoeciicola]|uniref:F0F1 ATP synthase subunit delta n=1 Tax=Candidatus Fukatsuia anoeciicola TaxID=2994492 RepID=UPI003464423F